MNSTSNHTERPEAYIGISGVINTSQQHELTEQFLRYGLHNKRRLALGVKAVHKTQFLDEENKYGPAWYPVGEQQFSTALSGSNPQELRVAQVYFDADAVHDTTYRTAFINQIVNRGQSWLNAIQFDMLPWHTDKTLLPFVEEIKESTGINILLQAHGPAMLELGPKETTKRLGHYAAALDFVLFDASHGRGVRMNPASLKPFLDETYASQALAGMGVAVAGGLNATAIRESLPELLAQYPDLSWDAEGQLHHPEGSPDRALDLSATLNYLEASQEALGEVQ